MDLPYEKKFSEIPESTGENFVQYFNLEYVLEFGPDEEKYQPADFKFMGLYMNAQGIETMYWSVKSGTKIYAIEQPYDGQSIVSMTDERPDPSRKIEL